MKSSILIIALFFFLSGCSLLRNSSKSSSEASNSSAEQSDFKSIRQEELSEGLNVVSSFKDSLNQDYEIQIWPKGKFSFSGDKGFVGEAEKIQVKGKAKRLMEYSEILNDQLKKQVIEDQQSRKEVLTEKMSSKAHTPSWKWIVVSLVFIVICFYWVKSRFNI